ncbi:MAG: D-glycero-beta-D-manno-heptose 1,7-bisphosphate 7-phosphatase, partial [Chloroflexota bacterium]
DGREPMRRAVFLDRDGVICHNRDDYVKSWEEFVFIPDAREALARLAQSDLQIVIATNQSAINRGIVSRAAVENIHARMLRAIEAAGGRVDLVTVCPHRPDEGCNCRKPRPGMLLAATQELDLDLSQSYLIGDAGSDIQAGQAVGCQCYLVLTGRGRGELISCWMKGRGFRVAADLEMAVSHILRNNIEIRQKLSFATQGETWRA